LYNILKGVRVVEVSSWVFMPAAGVVLVDWGADVVKVEHPVTGDLEVAEDPQFLANGYFPEFEAGTATDTTLWLRQRSSTVVL
jgi:crotonobetainyl-CoA:carnitine CoA-transferase CaiB-like acyl-CoA transferase